MISDVRNPIFGRLNFEFLRVLTKTNIMKNTFAFSITYLFALLNLLGQENFSSNPLDAKFVTTDFDNFWKAFDQLEIATGNPFEEYLEKASPGLRPFREYLTPEEMLKSVQQRKTDYLKCRTVLTDLPSHKKRIQAIYAALKYWYVDATFPPVYFVVGVFSSGGTVSENGLLIGTELLEDLNSIDALIAHELIHFQQTVEGPNTLLQQTLKEGTADFIGELTSGILLNASLKEYGNAHESELCKTFVKTMNTNNFGDWLYERNTTDGKPKDMGYWMGYKIVEAYFNRQGDKKKAIHDILNIKDPVVFLKESGYLKRYLEGKE